VLYIDTNCDGVLSSPTDPPLTATYTRQDLTTTSDVTLQFTKEVRNVTREGVWFMSNTARQGDLLEYQITYLNNGIDPIANLVVNDTTAAFTLYESAQCVLPLPPSLSSCTVSAAPPVGSPGSIRWTFSGSLSSSTPGTVTYQVKVE